MSSDAREPCDTIRPNDELLGQTWLNGETFGQCGIWLGPLRLTCRELREAANLLVTRLHLDATYMTPDEPQKQLQVPLIEPLLTVPP